MERYHIKTGFTQEDISLLKDYTDNLNFLDWNYTKHCLDNIKYRCINLESILLFIKSSKLKIESIFEFYKINNIIEKACYRLPYSKDSDIILVIGENKQIITIYLNAINDNHITLNKDLYINTK